MKKLLSFLICTALILSIIPTSVFAAGETSGICGNNLTWSYNTETATLTISGTGDMYGYSSNDAVPWYQYCSDMKYVTIGDKVTSIGGNAFYDCKGLTSITIPNSVTTIDTWAFSYCTGLTRITIPNSVTTIDTWAFLGCTGLSSLTVNIKNKKYYSSGNCIIEKDTNNLILGCKNSIIPYGVTSIGDSAFYGCKGLTSISIPNSVTSIGESAFSYCRDLTSITISNSLTSIDQHAFSSCEGLKSITIPDSVTIIGSSAFANCLSLTSITIPNSVTSIGSYVFYLCSGLTSITIPNSVTSIGNHVFSDCKGLSSITVDTKNEKYYSSGNCIIEKDTNKLISGCKDSVIPYGVTSIDYGAFRGCAGLTSIVIPNSVTGIGNEAFYYCTSLTSITISYGVTSIGYNAFSGCRGLTSIAISNSVTSIDYGAFSGCTALKIIYYTGSKEEWNKINLEYSRIPSNAEIIYNATDCDINGHSLGEWVSEIPATCTEGGVKGYYECSVCHKYFDKDKNEITDLAIPAHHTPELLKKIPLTCTDDGYDIVKCSSCGYRYTVNYVAATGHELGGWISEIPATCTEDGVKGHYECSVCHKYFDNNKEEITDTTIPAEHEFGEWILRIPETCTESGVREHYECSVCHKYFDKDKNEITDLVIPAHHDPSLIKAVTPTCTTDGYDVVKCLNCGLRYKVNYVAATGHSFGDWTETKKLTCTDDGVEIRRCGKCDETETRITKAKGHKQGELVKHQNATCTKDNGDYYKCLTCGETYFVLGFAKNGHWFLDGECIDCGIAESDVPFDIDLDCAVSATDLTHLKRILLSNKTAECDPNGDGKLNILDLIALKKRLAEK